MKKILVVLIFWASTIYSYQVTNISTNISEFITQTNTVTNHRYIPIPYKKYETVYSYVSITNICNLTNVTEVTNETDITNTVEKMAYKQHWMFSSGFSYCGRLFGSLDLMNIFSSDTSGVGLGIYSTWDTFHFPNHQLDVGGKFSVEW